MYFNKRRALANGICVSGTAAGSFVFPILIEYLIHKFGFHGTLLLLGAGMLHVCFSATLYRPLDVTESTKPSKCETSQHSTATNLTLLSASTNSDTKRYIEHLFMEESKNRLNDFYNTNKLGNFFYLFLFKKLIFRWIVQFLQKISFFCWKKYYRIKFSLKIF